MIAAIGRCACLATLGVSCHVIAQQINSVTSPSDLSAPDTRVSTVSSTSSLRGQNDWVHRWPQMVDKTRAEQPHYVAPLITTHVLLVQQYRFDSSWQTNKDGSHTDNYGNGRGLEIIPNCRWELQIAPPPYVVHNNNVIDGSGDVSLLVKFRAISAPEGKGDYFVGVFLSTSFPSGTPINGLGHTVLSPSLALAKGWKAFDIQNTFGGSLPASGAESLGRAFLWNATFQYSLKKMIWPMIEQNSTFYFDGPNEGKEQTFLTPGLVFGNSRLVERLHLGIGGGIQIAVTPFHTYDHHWVWSVRLPF